VLDALIPIFFSGGPLTLHTDTQRKILELKPLASISTNNCNFSVSKTWLVISNHDAFSVAGPMFWNSLPRHLHDPSHTDDVFGRLLKTFLFSEY